MKNVVVSMVAIAGLAAVANAQATSNLAFQVRQFVDGQAANANWGSSVTAAPGSRVEIRAVVSWIGGGDGPAALSGAIFQPTVSNWNAAADSLQDSNTTPGQGGGVGNFIQSGGGPTGGVTEDSGNYGRVVPFSFAGIGTSAALRGHVNNVGGVNYLRIAQNTATNWAGVGSSTSASNNVTGALGVPCVQKPLPQLTGTDPAPSVGNQGIVVFKFAINIGDVAGRESMTVSAPAESIRELVAGQLRGFTWFSSTTLNTADIQSPVSVSDATITIPTPGALALLGLGGLAVARRRR